MSLDGNKVEILQTETSDKSTYLSRYIVFAHKPNLLDAELNVCRLHIAPYSIRSGRQVYTSIPRYRQKPNKFMHLGKLNKA